MKLKPPQNAPKSQKPKREAKKDEKRVRRMAPDYRFRWGQGVWQAVHAMPAPTMEALRDEECYSRMIDAERARSNGMIVLNVYAMEGFTLSDPWWAPFDFAGHTFQLQFKTLGKIREYVLEFAPTPLIPPGSPAWEKLLKACLEQNEKDRKRGKKRGGAKNALPAASKRPPKQTDDKCSFTYVLYRLDETIVTVVEDLNHSLAHLLRPFRPKLLRNLVHMKRAHTGLVNSANNLVNRLVQTSQESALFAAKIVSSLTRARHVAVKSFGPGASLEPRCVGQNTGFPILLYSWFRDDEAIGALPSLWPTSWFGVLEWPANWFGPLPDEERVFV
jgi:hypothetical protein